MSDVTDADREAREAAAEVMMEFHGRHTWAYDPNQHAELEGLIAAAILRFGRTPPTWTGTPPTEPGWYGWRDEPFPDETLVELWERDEDGVVRCGEGNVRESGESILSRHPHSQWFRVQFPIPHPAE